MKLKPAPRLLCNLFLLVLAFLFAQRIAVAQMQPPRQQGGPSSPPADASNAQDQAPMPAAVEKPKTVYVTDFESDPAVSNNSGTFAGSSGNRGSLTSNGAAVDAQHIVKAMSENLVKDFAKAGYIAKTLRKSDLRPDDGFLILGVFTQVDPQNRLRRAVIAPGQNAAPIELYVSVDDLTGFTQYLYRTVEPEDDGDKPGAVIELNPEADAEKFPIDPNASEKAVKQTAQRITNDFIKRINTEEKHEPLNRYAKP